MEPQKTRFHEWIKLAVGFGLAIYPWVIGYSNNVLATQVSFGAGVLIILVSAAALVRFAEWEEWVNMLLGAGVAVSPFVFGLTNVDMAVQSLFLGGVIVMGISAYEIWIMHHPEGPAPLPH